MEASGQVHALASLLQKKDLWYPKDMRLDWYQNQFGRHGVNS
jgi:hypothetical protein